MTFKYTNIWKLHNCKQHFTIARQFSSVQWQCVKENVLSNIRKFLCAAVRKRVQTSERPIASLLSGGLDSSLVTALVNREHMMQKGIPIETYAIGLEGSEDLKYAQQVADYLGTIHKSIIVSEHDFFEAIPEVIKVIESYDTTTVRASVGNYLVAKYISKYSSAKVIFNGDGSDELTGGYMYFHACEDPLEFDKECRRLLSNIHYFDGLRSDRTISQNGLEARTPFLDRDWVQYYMSLDPYIRSFHYNGSMEKVSGQKHEKYLLRTAFEHDFDVIHATKGIIKRPLLPRNILWRTKEAFSDGVSSRDRSWYEIIDEKLQTINGELYETIKMYNWVSINHNRPATFEQKYYRYLFNSYYKDSEGVIPYFWMPKYVDAKDASARTLQLYQTTMFENACN
jgi:asparagine synthase (glutamine-hydrolysing)